MQTLERTEAVVEIINHSFAIGLLTQLVIVECWNSFNIITIH